MNEGVNAKNNREQRESLAKMFGNVDDTHELIVILTDLTGKEPTRVHIQGPSTDKVLLYGMLGVARDVIQLHNSKPVSELQS